MRKQYTDKPRQSTPSKAPVIASMVRRKLQQAYALSDAHASVIAELQGYGQAQS